MSDQASSPLWPPYDASRIRGVIYVDELGPDGTPLQLELYPVPAEALSLVKPTQVFGISSEELLDAPSEVQYLVMRTWFRLNHQPAPIELIWMASSTRTPYDPRLELNTRFGDPEAKWSENTNRLVLSGSRERLAIEIVNESRIWVQKPPEPRDALRQSALRALDGLEAVIRQVQRGRPARDDNHPPELLDDGLATLDNESREALVAIEDSRQELLAEPPNLEVLRRSAQTIIKLARTAAAAVGRMASATWSVVREPVKRAIGHVVKDAYDNGPDAAIAHLNALAHKASEAVMALQHFLSGL